MNYRKSALSTAIVTCLGFSLQIHAQEAPKQDATDLDTVSVVGIRGSVQKSLDGKREAAAHVEVVSSEDIGKLPAKNVADTLQRVAGINVGASGGSEGGFDESERVSMRGTSASLTQTLVNGHLVGTGDWLVTNQTSNVGRSVSYALFPAEIVDQVVVNKGSQAKLVEGGAAGTIDIRTRKPLDFKKDFTGEATLGAVYSDLPGKTEPQFSGLMNWKNADGDLGILVQAFHESRSLRRDGQEVVGGYGQISATSTAALADPNLAGAYYPNLIGTTLFTQKRERKGGTFDIQYKPTDTLTLDLNGFYSKLNANNYNRNYMLWSSKFATTQVPNSYTLRNGVLTNAVYPATSGGIPFTVYDQISRISESDSGYLALDADWQASDRLSFKFEGGTTKGHGKTPSQDALEVALDADAGASWSLGGTTSPLDWTVGSNGALDSSLAHSSSTAVFGLQDSDAKDKEDWFSADGELYFDSGVLSTLDFGVRYAEHTRQNNGGYNLKLATGALSGYTFPASSLHYPGDFGSAIGGSYPTDIWYYSESQLAAISRTLSTRSTSWQTAYRVHEQNAAAYVQANFAGDRWSGNVGVRYVHTTGENNYNQSSTISASGYVPVSVDNNYGKFLPSLNFKYEVSDDVVARFASSKTMTRADYSDLAGYISLTDLTHTGSGGNPNLKPIISTNYDLSLEWYFMPRGLLAGSVYYMDMKDFIAPQTRTATYKDQTASATAGSDVYASYLMSSPDNIDASVKGLELTYEQPLGDSFGLSANYTYADGKTETGGPLLGTSKNTYNLSSYFEHDKLSARVSYTWRSAFYFGPRRSYPFYQDQFGTLSATVSYRFNDRFSLSLDGLNLNNPVYKYYTKIGSNALPYAFYENGRQYYLNLHVSF